jgi:DNA processing protein
VTQELTEAQEAALRRNAASVMGEDRLRDFDARGEWRRAQDLGLSLLFRDEPGFPELLRCICDAPLVLYVWGRFEPEKDALAFVGSRQPTPYGRRMTRQLVREAAARFVITSGLARGIDTEAHRTALDSGGTTWAVLGSGLGRLYPPENAALAREIASGGGCLLSEFPLDAPPLPGNFPRRNRIVAGLSWGTVVVEGRDKSGSLITARLAAQQGREVFAVPGPADSALSEAPLRLISQGARMARSMADIRKALLAPEHEKILQLLGSETRSVAELGSESGLDISSLTQTLFELELQDLVEAVPGQRYAKKSS